MAREPTLARDEGPLFPGLDDIPDPVAHPVAHPAAHLAARPAPASAEPAPPAEPSLTRPERARRLALALLASLAWICGGVALKGLRRDLASPDIAVPLALLLVGAGAALWLTLRPRQRGLPAGVRVVQAVALGAPLAFAALVLVGAHPDEPTRENSTLPCLLLATEWFLVPFALAAFLLRRSFLTAPGWRGAAMGAVCGLAGSIAIQAHCRYASPFHVLVAHGLPVVVGAALGALAGSLRGRA